MCDIWKNTERTELTENEIYRLLPQLTLLKTREVVLTGGEPLMHGGIENICRSIKNANIKLSLVTTGLLLKRHASLVGEYVDSIIISLDGPETIHNKIRNIPNAFRKLTVAIKAVRGYDPSKKILGRCTVQSQNFRYLSETVTAAKYLGMDNISFLAVDVQPGHFGRIVDWKEANLALSPDELLELRTVLNNLYTNHAGDFENGYIIESQDKLERKLYYYFLALTGRSNFPPVRCNAPWVATVIETDGSVRPCYFHQPYHGNIKKFPISEILNSENSLGWRKKLNVNSNSVCRSCAVTLALDV